MIDTPLCDDKEQLVAYLYDELDTVVRRRVDDHLRICTACASEVATLSGVRRELAEWRPPDAGLGVTAIQTAVQTAVQTAPALPLIATRQAAASGLRPAGLPAWAQAAAAVLVVAAGLSVANIQVRYDAAGLVVTTGWMGTSQTAAPATVTRQPAEPAAAEWRTALTNLETSLRDEMRSLRQPEMTAVADDTPPRRAEVPMARVADMIEQSERRQQQELALRLTQLGRDLEVQRRSDLVRINQGFGQFEGRAGAEIARQRQMLDYIMRVSAPPPQ